MSKKTSTYDKQAVELMLNNAPQSAFDLLRFRAMFHMRVLSGEQCPVCKGRNCAWNGYDEAQCGDCGDGWVLSEWRTVAWEGKEMYRQD